MWAACCFHSQLKQCKKLKISSFVAVRWRWPHKTQLDRDDRSVVRASPWLIRRKVKQSASHLCWPWAEEILYGLRQQTAVNSFWAVKISKTQQDSSMRFNRGRSCPRPPPRATCLEHYESRKDSCLKIFSLWPILYVLRIDYTYRSFSLFSVNVKLWSVSKL